MAAVSALIQTYTVNNEVSFIYIKFAQTVHASTIDNFAFTLATDVATPVSVSDLFVSIDVTDSSHYNSIARELTLFVKPNKLVASTSYVLTIDGLTDAAGGAFDADSSITFTTPDAYDPTYTEDLPAVAVVVQVEDKSLKKNIYTEVTEITQANVNFYIESTDPDNQDWYIVPDLNNGRVIIKFSAQPSASFLNTKYITVQRKPVQRQPARWETLTVTISLDSDEPWLYIDFPSYDHFPVAATPASDTVYTTGGYGYFEIGYKYRIVLSKSLGY